MPQKGAAYLARVTLVFLDSRVVHDADVVVHVEVEQRPRLTPGLGHDQVVEREVLAKQNKTAVRIVDVNKSKNGIMSFLSATGLSKEHSSRWFVPLAFKDQREQPA